MKVRESKNLECDKTSKVTTGGDDYDKIEFQPEVCILESFERMDDTLILHFKNKTFAYIRAQNIEGGREIDLIERKLPEFSKRSYNDILEIDLTTIST